MKSIYRISIIALLFLLPNFLFAQDEPFDFMRLSGAGVTLWHGSYDVPRALQGSSPQSAHIILTRQEGTHSPTDDRTGGLLNVFPDDDTHTVFQLGDTLVSGYTNGLPNTVSGIYPSNAIDYVFDVDETNSLLLLNFAVVFEDPGGHTQNHKPLFGVKISDLNNNTLDACTEYEVSAFGGIEGFQEYQYVRWDYVQSAGQYQWVNHTVRWRDWTAIGLDLSPYAGHQVKVNFTTKDCYDGSHYAYTYFTAKCVNNSLVADCTSDDEVTLSAPFGFSTYTWSGEGGSGQTATYDIPDNGLRVTCHLTSFTGCQCDLMAYIVKYSVTPGTHILVDTTCSSRPYTYNNYNIPVGDLSLGDNVYVNTIVEAGECDNVATTILQLYVVDDLVKHVYADVCEIDGYHDDSISINNPMIGAHEYTFNLHSGLGCDSTVIVHLNTSENPKRFVNVTKCQGDVFDVYYGNSLSKTYVVGAEPVNNDTIRFEAPTGCDSIVVVSINVNPAWTIDNVNDISDLLYTELGQTALCVNEAIYDFHGFDLVPDENNPGEIYDTLWGLHTTQGCDSIVVIHLGVLPYNNESLSFNACYGDAINNHIYYAAMGGYATFPEHVDVGHYQDTVHYPEMFSGCDSWAIRNLNIWPVEDTIVRDTICSNQTYSHDGFDDYTPPVQYFPYGIYSIEDQSYIFRDTLFTTTKHGCDSTVYLELLVNKAYMMPIYAEICEGEDYINDTLPFFNQTQPGLGIMNAEEGFTTALSGCDSIYILTLNVKEVFRPEINAEICLGDEYNEYNLDTIPVAVGVVRDTFFLTSRFGCDSIVSFEITVHEVYDTIIVDTICDNQTYTNGLFHFENQPAGLIDTTLHLTSIHYCDSTVNLRLLVAPTYLIPIVDEICYGQDYHNDSLPFFNKIHPEVGTVNDSKAFVTNVFGCDSIYELSLTVKEVYNTPVTGQICFGERYNLNGFDTIPGQTGLFRDTLFLTSGLMCDSVVPLELMVREVYDYTIVDSVCYGENYTLNGFNIQNPAEGWHVDEYLINPHSQYDCDSIVRLSLKVNEAPYTELKDTVCEGSYYNRYNFTVSDVLAGLHTYEATYPSIYACDSLVRLYLYGNPLLDTTLYDVACVGVPYTNNGFNETVNEIGPHNYQLDLSSVVTGCDSTVYLNLDVYDGFVTNILDSICLGDVYDQNGFNLTPMYPTTLYQTLPLQSQYGCDSIVNLTLKVYSGGYQAYQEVVCWNDTYTEHGFNINVSETFPNLTTPASYNIYNDTSSYNIHGCLDNVSVYLTVNPLSVVDVYGEVCEGDVYDGYNFHIENNVAGTYVYDTMMMSERYGCDSTTYLHLTVHPVYDTTFTEYIGLNQDYHGHGFDIIQPGEGIHDYDTLYYTIHGCDSVVRLTLNVFPTQYFTVHDSICEGEDYTTYPGFEMYSPAIGSYEDTLIYYDQNQVPTLVYFWTLDVNPVFEVHLYDEICEGLDYDNDVNHFQISTSALGVGNNDFDVLGASIHGCDSTTYLHLTVNPIYDTLFTEYIGIGDDFHGHGFDVIQPSAGMHQIDTLYYTIMGCDSVVRLNLDVFDTQFVIVHDSICEGEDYTVYPGYEFYDSTLVYYDEHQVVSEVYYLTLDVNPVYNYTFYDTICDNQSYIENNFSYITPAAGHYDETQSLTTIHGCDSIVNLSLEVYPTYATHATDSVCYGDVYVGPGFVINSATLGVGRHQDTTVLQSIHSCDSVIYLDLTVLPVYDSVIVDTICYKEDYTSYGFNIIQPAMGDSFDTLFLSTINSCDSTVYLELHVKPSHDTIIDVAICHGEDYIDNGFEYIQPEVGTVRDTLWLTNMYGCDSAVMLDLKVYPTFDRVVVESICEGEDYNGNGFHIVAPSVGLHLDTLRLVSAHGCDSVVSLNLTVYPNFETVFDVEIVSGDDYIDNGFSYIQPRVGIYHDSLLYNSEHGCDSMVKLNLTVMPVPEVFIEDTVCQGVDYLLEGFVVLHGEPGIVHDTLFLTNMFGGDSTVYLTLTRLPEYDTVYTEFICYGESYTEHGFNIINPAVGTYIDTLRYESVLGCDSTEYLNLTVYPLMDSLVVAEICEGEDYIDNEFTVLHPSVGVHRDTLLVGDDYGCTMYYLELTVNPINYTFLMPQICEGNNYVNNGFNIIQPSAGMVYDTLFLTNDYGCDSTVYLALTVNPVYNTYYTDSICYGEDYDKYGFTILQPAVGVIEESYVLQTLNGCDSTFYLTLTVNPVHDTLITAQICYGDSYDDNGFSFINPEIGVYYDTLSLNNIFGCDSIVSLQLTVNPVFDTLFVDEICQGDDYTLHGFEIIQPAAGSYYDTLYLTTVSGCDSLVYLDLTINPSFKAYFEGELCYGENYNEHGFNIIKPEVGVHYDSLNLATIHGCDSTLYLTLTVNPVYETWYNAEICYGEDYSGYGFEFINPSVGLHKDTLFYQTVNGCDSLICMKLRVWPKFNRQINATICNGEDYDEYGFHFVNPPVGVTHDTLFLHSVHGCDSVVRLVLNVLPVFDFGYSEITGHENVYVSTNLQTGRYKYTIDPITYCNNYRWEIIGTGDWVVEPQGNVCFVVVTTPGTCTLRVIAENECSYTDREIEITGSFYGVEEYEMIEADVYPNPTKDVIIIESESIIKTTVLGLHGQKVKCDNFEGEDKVRIDVGDLPRGSYILLIETNSGRIFKNIIIER